MSKITSLFIAATAATVLATAALAQSAAPEVPNPAHPFPDNPVATDGSSIRSVWPSSGYAARAVEPAEQQAYAPARYRRR